MCPLPFGQISLTVGIDLRIWHGMLYRYNSCQYLFQTTEQVQTSRFCKQSKTIQFKSTAFTCFKLRGDKGTRMHSVAHVDSFIFNYYKQNQTKSFNLRYTDTIGKDNFFM